MLKTNTNKARENTLRYILEDGDYIEERASYDGIELQTPAEYCAVILEAFKSEYGHEINRRGEYAAFKGWAQGLAMGGLFLYYYNKPARDIVAGILEETPEEAARYTEEQAEELLTRMIFNTVSKYAAGVELRRA